MIPKSPPARGLAVALILGLFVTLFSQCGSVKHEEMLMLEEVQHQDYPLDSFPLLRIQPDDILGITVKSRNPETVIAFQNLQNNRFSGASGEQALGQSEGYRVDENGLIFLPFLGEVEAGGKTITELRDEITTRLSDFIPDATLQVRFLNFRVTVLGEVLRPNTYIIPNEKLTVLEAIGMAGDFTPYARRNSVLVIRERDNRRELGRIDTQRPDLFESPYFYLSPNDIVYVEPLKAKQYATTGDFVQRYSIVLVPVISFLTAWAAASLFN